MQSPRRKDIRLKNYNYAKEGMYFITICTKNRRNILSNIIYEINYSNEKKSVGVTALGDPYNIIHNKFFKRDNNEEM